MRTITITTTQNVSIEYELAALKDRIFAFLLDSIIIQVGGWTLTGFAMALFTEIFEDGEEVAIYGIFFPVFFLYTLVSEILMNGQTLGKKALNIRVAKTTGREPQIGDYIVRWAFRMIDIYGSMGAIAAILISSSEKHQRLGGLLSNSAVIKVRPSRNFSLNDILSINSVDNHEVKYPEIRAMSEKDMLVIKLLLDRIRKYPNDAHKNALTESVKKVIEKTGMDEVPKNRVLFLRDALMDYIVLTR